MAVKTKHKGTKVYLKSCGLVEVCDENEELLTRNGHGHLFQGTAKPKKKKEEPKEESE